MSRDGKVSRYDKFCKVVFGWTIVVGYCAVGLGVCKVILYFTKSPHLTYIIGGIIFMAHFVILLRGFEIIDENGFDKKGFYD